LGRVAVPDGHAGGRIDAYFTFLRKQIIDWGITPEDTAALARIGVIYAVMIRFRRQASSRLFIWRACWERVIRSGKKLFNHLQDLSLKYYSQTPVGWIMSRHQRFGAHLNL
jgi:ATP-binding cassette subfamily B protein